MNRTRAGSKLFNPDQRECPRLCVNPNSSYYEMLERENTK
jgi:hypothetical protein